MDFGSLKSRIRALVDDPEATYATDAFINPLINQKYEELFNRMLSTGAEFERGAVELINVAAGTKDLSAYNLGSKELEFLVQPTTLEWKQAGLDSVNYRLAKLVDRVSDVQANQFVQDWEFRAGVIYFTPSVLALDLRVRGDFFPSSLREESDQVTVIKNFAHALAYGAAALIGLVRGNQAWSQAYTLLQDNAVDDIMQYLVRKDQAKIRRMGRMSRRQWPRPTSQQPH